MLTMKNYEVVVQNFEAVYYCDNMSCFFFLMMSLCQFGYNYYFIISSAFNRHMKKYEK